MTSQYVRAFVRVAAVAALLLGALAPADRAQAHARYDHSDPAAGATLATAPTKVSAWFGEELAPAGNSLTVWDSAGKQVDKKDSKVDAKDAKLMTVSLNSGLTDGVYTVKWTSVSAGDGDTADGDFQFGIGKQPVTTLTTPAQATTLTALTATLGWTLPAGAALYNLQVVPFEEDGPGVDLIQTAAASYTIASPPSLYLLLPDMSYTWRVRATLKAGVSGDDPSWGPWSDARVFITPPPSSKVITAVAPAKGSTVTGGKATLQWASSDPALFYWEVQASTDGTFNTDAKTGTAPVWWNLVHGGVSVPGNSWQTPALKSGATYFWRVRPRVQGSGTAVDWSETWSFKAS